MDVTVIVIGAAWLALALMLAWGLSVCLYRLFTGPSELPFFVMLEHRGLNARQVEAAAGAGGMARALRRCALCKAKSDCGRRPVDCPNEALFQHVSRLA